MAKKASKASKSNELDGKEFFEAISMIEKEKGIPKEYMVDRITQALVSAYKKDHEGITDNIFVDADEAAGQVRMYVKKEVVEQVDNPSTELSLDEARVSLSTAQLGDIVRLEIKPRNFGRIAAQTARQVIIQGMREAEHGMIYEEFTSKEQEMMQGIITRMDQRSGTFFVRIGSGSEIIDANLAVAEQVRGEVLREGDRIRVYVVEVRRTNRGPQVLVSRTHPGLIRRLFELEVPEIYEGIVEIRSIAREAGSRTKIAVWSSDENIDPIGSCVGPKGARVGNVVGELVNEKIDIIKYSDDPEEFVAAALAPAEVISVYTLPGEKSCQVIVPDHQLSLTIGKEGQNARLAAKLTGYKIDIRPESASGEFALTGDEEPAEPSEDTRSLTDETPSVAVDETAGDVSDETASTVSEEAASDEVDETARGDE